jgi:hypothetical protein
MADTTRSLGAVVDYASLAAASNVFQYKLSGRRCATQSSLRRPLSNMGAVHYYLQWAGILRRKGIQQVIACFVQIRSPFVAAPLFCSCPPVRLHPLQRQETLVLFQLESESLLSASRLTSVRAQAWASESMSAQQLPQVRGCSSCRWPSVMCKARTASTQTVIVSRRGHQKRRLRRVFEN